MTLNHRVVWGFTVQAWDICLTFDPVKYRVVAERRQTATNLPTRTLSVTKSQHPPSAPPFSQQLLNRRPFSSRAKCTLSGGRRTSKQRTHVSTRPQIVLRDRSNVERHEENHTGEFTVTGGLGNVSLNRPQVTFRIKPESSAGTGRGR